MGEWPLQQTSENRRNLLSWRLLDLGRVELGLFDCPNEKAYGECERDEEEDQNAPADTVAPGVDGIDLGDESRHSTSL